ncbi:hypothetical protein POTOM_010869 [Populus tomentosa]|uniref:Uncharacterized protein n=1 Tax=Populus tomentosa TaxID=118781 RepID=A0A8X8AB85_POPTO|nr:hypothetical protein POTOM_010869 [Populus tomentosa]
MVKILMGKLIRLLTRDQEFVRLNYVVSEVGFVDHFLSCNDLNFSPGTELKNTVGKKVSPALSARGCQHLAKGIETRTPTRKNKTFEWVDSDRYKRIDFFGSSINESFDSGGCRQRYDLRHRKAGYVDGKGGCSDDDWEDKSVDLHQKVTSSPHTDSGLQSTVRRQMQDRGRIRIYSGNNFFAFA